MNEPASTGAPAAAAPPKKGFSLLEILVATAILAIVFAYVSGSVVQSGFLQAKVPLYTNASLLIRSAVLDTEASFRKDGLPEEDVSDERCELPDDIGDGFECEYDVEKLDLEGDDLSQMAAQLMESLMAGSGEDGNFLQAFSILAPFLLAGDQVISPLCPATGPQVLEMCSVRPELIQQNIMGMVSFFPTIIEQAAQKTRKLRVRISREGEDEPVLEIETFIVAVPEEQKLLTEEGATKDPTEGDGTNKFTPPPPPPPPQDNP